MSIYAAYTRQIVTRLPCTGTDKSGQPIYGVPVVENVRWDDVRRMVRNTRGEAVVSEALLLTETRPDLRDKYRMDGRDWPILAVSTIRTVAGTVVGYEVSL